MLEPIGDRVIVKVKEEEEKTVGGIVLASNAKKKQLKVKLLLSVTVLTLQTVRRFLCQLRRAT